MSNIDDELSELAAIYRQLVDFKPFQRLVEEMKTKIEDLKESNINNFGNIDDATKGIVAGIKTAIFTPHTVIKEFDDSLTRE